jgi:uncharacterized RDD family membrane protein YckC
VAGAPPSRIDPYAPPTVDVDAPPATTPDQGRELADRIERFMGAFLDGLVATPLLLIGAQYGPKVGAVSIYSHLFVLPVHILQWYLITTRGQTIGKIWQKTRIERMDGRPVGFFAGVVLRVLVLQAIAIGLDSFATTPLSPVVFVVGALMFANPLFIFGPAHRCLHDYIAGTRVVKLPLVAAG